MWTAFYAWLFFFYVRIVLYFGINSLATCFVFMHFIIHCKLPFFALYITPHLLVFLQVATLMACFIFIPLFILLSLLYSPPVPIYLPHTFNYRTLQLSFFRWQYFAVYYSALSFPRLRSAHCKAITEHGTKNNLEGGSSGHIEVTSRYLAGGTEKIDV
jgi:hypothetical protein